MIHELGLFLPLLSQAPWLRKSLALQSLLSFKPIVPNFLSLAVKSSFALSTQENSFSTK
jgi:hypothetical protein